MEFHVWSPRLTLAPSARPMASPLARLQVARGDPITNLRHERADLDQPTRQLLALVDGTRDRDALVEALTELVASGALRVQRAGDATPLPVGEPLREVLRVGVEATLAKLARAALLVE